ncbi:M10 family metallopeptidase C-terminal domain-containing protein, partial [Sandarakinorhabdus sp.]|uniref:M10 family metallopeptidase C-terminal domain-containing protein n=1 Tax=Sandarakinorhabdus sp. TaxID=1916663 RepID=UPI00286EB29B
MTLTNAQINSALRTPGASLGVGQFSYSVPTLASIWPTYRPGSEPFSNYGVLSAVQAGHFRSALALWDQLIAPNFTEIVETPASIGEIRVAFTTAEFGTGFAYSGPPQPSGGRVGDVWIDHRQVSEDFAPGLANGLYETLLHEIGHTLGLKHPFETPVIPAPFDNQRFTVMSYEGPGIAISFSGGSNTIQSFIAQVATITPMVLDIAAVQAIYGASTTTRADNSTYRFSEDSAAVQAVYDSGGIDTFDLSNFTRPNIIDLRPGAYSSLGQFSRADQISFWTERFPNFGSFITSTINSAANLFTFNDNVGIALNVTIENALGGSADDEIIGNAAANRLAGNGGADRLTGGGGTDTAVFSGGRRDYEVTRNGDTVTVRDLRANADGTDTLIGIEQAQFADGLMGLIAEELVLFLPGTRDLITWDSTQGSNGFTYFFRLGANSTVAAVADFTGDGRTDVLL